MRKAQYQVVLLLSVGILLIAAVGVVHAQGGDLPDLAVVDVYICKVWQGHTYTDPVGWYVIYRVSYRMRNIGPVPAVSSQGPIGTGAILSPAGFLISRPAATASLAPGAAWGPEVWRSDAARADSFQERVSISVDPAGWIWGPYGKVRETDEVTNNRYFVTFYAQDLPWCPGYHPRAYGVVFRDDNRNGRQDGGEPGIAGVIVQLWQGNRRLAQTRSGANGSWSMAVNEPGTYSLAAVVPQSVRNALGGSVFWTTPSHYYNVSLTGGASGPYRFGLAAMPPPPPAQAPVQAPPTAHIGFGALVTHPVVIGQDPDRRGADVFVTIRAYPVTYTWYEYTEAAGRWQKRQAIVTDYVDLDSIRLTATLTEQSRTWIRTDLAARYPGARVRRPFWNLRAQPTYRIVRNEVLASGVHLVRLAVTRIPFEDPGVYNVRLTARTTGTSWPGSRVTNPDYLVKPARTSTNPQSIRASAALRVYLLETTIVR